MNSATALLAPPDASDAAELDREESSAQQDIPGLMPSRARSADAQRPAGAVERNPVAIGAFAASLVGLFVLPLPMGVASLALGGYALWAMTDSAKTNGKAMAIAALLIGAIDVGYWVMWTLSQMVESAVPA
jgi:hypothetical protein